MTAEEILKSISPEVLQNLINAQTKSAPPPHHMPYWTVFDKETGEPLRRWPVDAQEQLQRGDVVDHPAKAVKHNPEAAALASEQATTARAGELGGKTVPELKALYRELLGQQPHSRMGKKRLIDEILAAEGSAAAASAAEGSAARESDEETASEPSAAAGNPTKE